jgi:hypothetical protein
MLSALYFYLEAYMKKWFFAVLFFLVSIAFTQERSGFSVGLEGGIVSAAQFPPGINGLTTALSVQYQFNNDLFLDSGLSVAIHNPGVSSVVPIGGHLAPFFGLGFGNKVDGLAFSLSYVYYMPSPQFTFMLAGALYYQNWFLRYTFKQEHFPGYGENLEDKYYRWNFVTLGYSFLLW